MKRTVTRVCALLLACLACFLPLAGCGKAGSGGGDLEKQPSVQGTVPEPAWPRPDYSDFVLPEESRELVLYTAGANTGAVMRPAVEIFKSLYPHVNVTCETVGEDEFDERIRAELPAGKGPDLLLFINKTIPDVYKTESTGSFEDLGGYFEADPEIDRADFEFIVEFYSNIVVGLISQWMDLGMQLPKEITTDKVLRVLDNSIENIMERFQKN